MINFEFWKKEKRPFSYKNLTRFLVFLIVVLAILAGYYQSALKLERKKYLRLEDRYVRVREELGVDETQKLIDQSRQKSDPEFR